VTPHTPSRFLVPALLALGSPLLAMDWPSVDVHGFVSQGYLHSTGNDFAAGSTDGTFAYNEVGLNISSQVTDRLRVGAQLFAYDLGDYGNNELLIDWAYGDYRHNDLIGARLGRFKLPMGLYNEMLDLDLAFTAVLLPQAVYDARYRELFGGLNGIQLYGILPLGAIGSVEYQIFAGSTNLSNDGYLAEQFTSSGLGMQAVDSLGVDSISGLNLNWRPPVTGLRLNAALLYADDVEVRGSMSQVVAPLTVNLPVSATIDQFIIGSLGFEYSADRITLAGEYRVLHGNVDVKVDASQVGGGIVTDQELSRTDGGYLMAAYRLNDAWEIGSYYGFYWNNRNDRDGDRFADNNQDRFRAWQRDLAVTVRWDINPSWIVKIEGHYIDGTAMLPPDTDPDEWERHWFLFAAKTTLSF